MAANRARLHVVGPDEVPSRSPHRVRIVDAALRCVARQGTRKTTIDDIARQAGLSRATVYRVFSGGKDEVLAAVVETETARLFAALGVRMGEAEDLSDVLVAGIVEAATRIGDHAALTYLLEHEPEVVLCHLAFDASNALLATTTRFAAPFLGRWMAPDEAERVAELAARIVLSYVVGPSEHTDLRDPRRVRRLVETFVLPGIRALQAPEPAGSTDPATTALADAGPVGLAIVADDPVRAARADPAPVTHTGGHPEGRTS